MIYASALKVSLAIMLPITDTCFTVQIQYQYFQMNSNTLPPIIGFIIGLSFLINIDFKTKSKKKVSVKLLIVNASSSFIHRRFSKWWQWGLPLGAI